MLGSALYLYGTTGPQYGQASVALNGQVVAPHVNLTVSVVHRSEGLIPVTVEYAISAHLVLD